MANVGRIAAVPGIPTCRSARCTSSVSASGIGRANAANASGKRIALVRAVPMKRSDRPGNARISDTADNNLSVHPGVEHVQYTVRVRESRTPTGWTLAEDVGRLAARGRPNRQQLAESAPR